MLFNKTPGHSQLLKVWEAPSNPRGWEVLWKRISWLHSAPGRIGRLFEGKRPHPQRRLGEGVEPHPEVKSQNFLTFTKAPTHLRTWILNSQSLNFEQVNWHRRELPVDTKQHVYGSDNLGPWSVTKYHPEMDQRMWPCLWITLPNSLGFAQGGRVGGPPRSLPHVARVL